MMSIAPYQIVEQLAQWWQALPPDVVFLMLLPFVIAGIAVMGELRARGRGLTKRAAGRAHSERVVMDAWRSRSA